MRLSLFCWAKKRLGHVLRTLKRKASFGFKCNRPLTSPSHKIQGANQDLLNFYIKVGLEEYWRES